MHHARPNHEAVLEGLENTYAWLISSRQYTGGSSGWNGSRIGSAAVLRT